MQTWTGEGRPEAAEVVWFAVPEDAPYAEGLSCFGSLLDSEPLGKGDGYWSVVTKRAAMVRIANSDIGEQRPAQPECCQWSGRWYNGKAPAPYAGRGTCWRPTPGVWGVDPPLTLNADGSATCCDLTGGQVITTGGISLGGAAPIEYGPVYTPTGGISIGGEAPVLRALVVCYINEDPGGTITLGDCDKLVFNLDGPLDVLGLSGGVEGRIIILHNDGADVVVLRHAAALDPTEQIFWPLESDYTLWPNESMVLEWDGVREWWSPDVPTLGTSESAIVPTVYPLRHLQIGPGLSFLNLGAGVVHIAAGDVHRASETSSDGASSDLTMADAIYDTLTLTTFGGNLLVMYTFCALCSSVNIQTDVAVQIQVDGVGTNASARFNLTSFPGGSNTQQPVCVTVTGLVTGLAAGVHTVDSVLRALSHLGVRINTRTLTACEQGPA